MDPKTFKLKEDTQSMDLFKFMSIGHNNLFLLLIGNKKRENN